MSDLRIAFAGDRDISVQVLEYILSHKVQPLALMIEKPGKASHAEDLKALCPHIIADHVLIGDRFRQPEGIGLLKKLNLDFIISVHFQYIFPEGILSLPRYGVLNLHPAYLPYNRGWHTPSWAILDNTPAGATLHFMDAGIDTGDIIYQKQLDVAPQDTADSLYQKIKRLELKVFREAWPQLESRDFSRTPQPANAGTTHTRKELEGVRRLDLDHPEPPELLIRKLRALTTNRPEEAAYFIQNGKRYHIQVKITEHNES